MLKVTLIGTAALAPIPERALSSAFLSCDGHSILFDCGEGTQSAARRAGVSLMKTDMIALTHYHGDHIFGLPGLLQTMCVMGRTQPIYICGPKGIEQELEPILKLTGRTTYDIKLFELDEQEILLRDIIDGWKNNAKLSAFKTEHRVSSVGYVFELDRPAKFYPEKAEQLNVPKKQWSILQSGQCVEADGKIIAPHMVSGEPRNGLKFVFSGDTTYCENLVDNARNADLLICDATYGQSEQTELAEEHGHMTFVQAATAAKMAETKRLWLTHYSQMIRDPSEYLENATDIFQNTQCGNDGMSIELRFD